MFIEQTPEANTVFFVWLNQYSGILLKTPTETLVIDPVDVKAKNIGEIDAVLITHEHYDHLDPPLVAEIQKQTGCKVIADAASAKKLAHLLPTDKLQEIKPGDQTTIGAAAIKAEKSNHPAQAPVTFIITSQDGVKIYHTSDSLPFPELELMAQQEQFDVVFCTVGIAPGASPETGFEIARLTKPPLVVPYHTASAQSQTVFEELVKRDLRMTTCLVPQQNKIYQITKRQTP
ncbi:MAG: MBL fold metallo-hydrolase [Candidatus Bathyarchaeia archaeon]|jgi:L-ascorbate metabolism protein UlaG (beta-lactamase superfamily)